MLRIGIIVGSTRAGRRGREVADWVHARAQGRAGAAYEVVDLADHDLPNLADPVAPMAGRYERPATLAWARAVAALDGFVVVTPEYNHGPSGALKNALDHLYAEWNDKAVGFVSYGMDGGHRAVEQLRLVAAELQLATVRNQVGISLRDDVDADGAVAPTEHPERQLDGVLDQVEAWGGALQGLRADHARSSA
ncbi:NADPH-dependent FMN reductase [Nocardioides bruguierae]|uniref:NAD(P)H-dependent oxidoreductase n=1 Tax=Nocardioides bruguierae TaxID=2945102 RepID=A0A9X2D4F8_9ACTN|nr:NAD(P)H-dependent oxidoreductase [Nocardioides bruguierae]MCM0619038.1 NAD(P)H-dependent oxidoreductase [Nocardioides bruguierae]